jgi:hypothetical protein
MENSNLPALQQRLYSLTEKIFNHAGSVRSLRALKASKALVFRQVHEETMRMRAKTLAPARELSRLIKNKSLNSREAFVVQIAVELFHSVSEERIDYATRIATRPDHH